jgi:hypothetical protein
MGCNTFAKFVGAWGQLLYYIYRAQEADEFAEDRPTYQFANSEQKVFYYLVVAVEDAIGGVVITKITVGTGTMSQ